MTNKSGVQTKNAAAPQKRERLVLPKLAYNLSILLVLQLGVAVGLFASQREYKSVEPTTALITCNPETLSKITIEQGKETGHPGKLVLKKTKSGWVIPEAHDFPADQRQLLRTLFGIRDWKQGIPVATTAEGADRFKVGAENFLISITLVDDHRVSNQLLIGASPSYKSFYVRRADSKNIYCIEFPGDFSIPTSVAEIFDKEYARQNFYGIEGFSVGNSIFSEVKGGSGWTATVNGKEQRIGVSIIKAAVEKLFKFKIESLQGTEKKPEYNLENPDLVCKFTYQKGDPVTYTFSKTKDQSHHILKMSNNVNYLEVDNTVPDSINALPGAILATDEKRNAVIQILKNQAKGPSSTASDANKPSNPEKK